MDLSRHRVRQVLIAVISVAALAAPAAAQATTSAGTSVFAPIAAPGYPSDSVVTGGMIYTGTFKSFTSPTPAGPSKVFAFDQSGRLTRTYTVTGQASGVADAVQVATVDRSGTLYLLDQDPARVVTLDPRTGAQSTYATFATVPVCRAGQTTGCTDGTSGSDPEPDLAAWGPDGSLYVTDYNQDLIWRVAPGGGAASIWLTDARFDGLIVGPAGIQLMADGHTLMVATGGGGSDVATGKLYTIPIEPDGSPGPLHQLWESGVGAAPDGFALARSGDVYLAEVGPTGNDVVEISPQGHTLRRFGGVAGAGSAVSMPFDAPGSVSFDGDRVIVTNEASIDAEPAHWALLAIDVGEPGLAESLPPAAPAPARHRKATKHRQSAHRRHRRSSRRRGRHHAHS